MKKTTVALLVLTAIIISSAGSVAAFDISSLFSGIKEKVESIISPYSDSAIFYPSLRVEVLSPNGGEVWNKDKIQIIKWEIWNTSAAEAPIQNKVSIDLYKRTYVPCTENQINQLGICTYNTVFVRHIDTVGLWDKYYKWRINDDIANNNNYIIRITPLMYKAYIEPYEKYLPEDRQSSNVISSYWDESDKPFTIKGEIYPDLDEAIKSLKKIRMNLLETANEIQNLIKLLEELDKD